MATFETIKSFFKSNLKLDIIRCNDITINAVSSDFGFIKNSEPVEVDIYTEQLLITSSDNESEDFEFVNYKDRNNNKYDS
jgi:hypothetical protein